MKMIKTEINQLIKEANHFLKVVLGNKIEAKRRNEVIYDYITVDDCTKEK